MGIKTSLSASFKVNLTLKNLPTTWGLRPTPIMAGVRTPTL